MQIAVEGHMKGIDSATARRRELSRVALGCNSEETSSESFKTSRITCTRLSSTKTTTADLETVQAFWSRFVAFGLCTYAFIFS